MDRLHISTTVSSDRVDRCNLHGISVGYILCGTERRIVDLGQIYTERLFGAATKKTDKTLFRVPQFLKATALFVVFIFCFSYGLACFVVFSYPVR